MNRVQVKWNSLLIFTIMVVFSLGCDESGNSTTHFTDPRDQQKYRKVKIGDLVWMGENLSYKTKDSWCYDNNESNCKKYGRLYNFNVAMEVCPDGWYLPSREDWDNLEQTIGRKVAGKKLKSKKKGGTDDYGWSALPGGFRYSNGNFQGVENGGFWWSATGYMNDDAYSRGIGMLVDIIGENLVENNYGLSVRCVQDSKLDNAPFIQDNQERISWYNESATEFTIITAKQLVEFAQLVNNWKNFNGKTVKLGADIMLNDTANWQNWTTNPPKNKWIPIGGKEPDDCDDYCAPVAFSGTFDGNNFVVSGVYVRNPSSNNQGLFGFLAHNGTIRNLSVTASYIEGKEIVGGLAGYSRGTIGGSSFGGRVTGDNYVGGLVGYNHRAAYHCYELYHCDDYHIVNYPGVIHNSHFNGKVAAKGNNVGDLVGHNEKKEISK